MTSHATVPWPSSTDVGEGDLWIEISPTGEPSLVIAPAQHALAPYTSKDLVELAARMHPDDIVDVVDAVAPGAVPDGVASPPCSFRLWTDSRWHQFGLSVTRWPSGSRSMRVIDRGRVDHDLGTGTVLERLPTGVVIGTDDDRGLWANRSARRMLGLMPSPSPVYRHWLAGFTPEDIDKVARATRKAHLGRASSHLDVRCHDERELEIDIAPFGRRCWTLAIEDATERNAVRRRTQLDEAFEQQLAALAADFVIVCDEDLVVRRIVGQFAAVPDFDLRDLIGLSWTDILARPPAGVQVEFPDEHDGAPARAMRTGTDQVGSRVTLRFESGVMRQLDVRASTFTFEDRRHLLIGLSDRTALAAIERRVSAYAHLSAGLAATLDPEGVILHATARLEHVLGWDRGSACGRLLASRIPEVDADAFRRLRSEAPPLPDIREAIIRVSGRGTEHLSLVMRSARDRTTGLVYISMIDVTDDLRDRDRLTHLAEHDSLTGLANRRQLDLFGASLLAGQPGAIALIDIDHFKEVNDTFGHSVGDGVLVAFAGRLVNAARGADLVVRLGGDEFVVVMPGVSRAEDAHALSDRLLRSTSGAYRVDKISLDLTSSVGVALVPPGIALPEGLAAADRLLYDAKRHGRSRSVISAIGGPLAD